jgi:hypothetical protein
MVRSPLILALAACALSACQPYMQPRPFAGRGGQSLDSPPRYGDGNRYVEPIAPGAQTDPSAVVPPVPSTPVPSIPGAPGVDQGLSLTPTPSGPAAPTTPTVTTPSVPTTPTVTAPTPAPTPAASDVPFARSVAGKPGYVYSPKDPKKIISVDGLRPGSKAKDPETGEIFRVPFQ